MNSQQKRGISNAWFKRFKEPEKQERFKEQVMSAEPVLEVLRQILEEWRDVEERVLDPTDTPQWEHKVTHSLAKRKAYKRVIDLITIPYEE